MPSDEELADFIASYLPRIDPTRIDLAAYDTPGLGCHMRGPDIWFLNANDPLRTKVTVLFHEILHEFPEFYEQVGMRAERKGPQWWNISTEYKHPELEPILDECAERIYDSRPALVLQAESLLERAVRLQKDTPR